MPKNNLKEQIIFQTDFYIASVVEWDKDQVLPFGPPSIVYSTEFIPCRSGRLEPLVNRHMSAVCQLCDGNSRCSPLDPSQKTTEAGDQAFVVSPRLTTTDLVKICELPRQPFILKAYINRPVPAKTS